MVDRVVVDRELTLVQQSAVLALQIKAMQAVDKLQVKSQQQVVVVQAA
jgi:hypothetical protein